MATTMQLSPKQMAECWEAFSLNRNLTELTERWMPSFKNELLKQSDRSTELLLRNNANAKPLAVVTTRHDHDGDESNPTMEGGSNKRDSQGLHMVTPPAKRAWQQHQGTGRPDLLQSTASQVPSGGRTRVSLSPGPPPRKNAERLDNNGGPASNSHPYHDRTNRGKVVYTYNPANLEAWTVSETATSPSSRSIPKCRIDASFPSNVSEPYRHMFTTLDERALALDHHLVQLGNAIATKYNIVAASDYDNEDDAAAASSDIAPLEAVGVPRQEKVCCLGRICNSVRRVLVRAAQWSVGTTPHTPFFGLARPCFFFSPNRPTKVGSMTRQFCWKGLVALVADNAWDWICPFSRRRKRLIRSFLAKSLPLKGPIRPVANWWHIGCAKGRPHL